MYEEEIIVDENKKENVLLNFLSKIPLKWKLIAAGGLVIIFIIFIAIITPTFVEATSGCDSYDVPYTIRTETPEWGVDPDYADYTSTYECPAYAKRRANEILKEIGSDKTWNHGGDAYTFCDHAESEGFTKGTEPKPGSIFVWCGGFSSCPSCPCGKYGHVGIIESIEGDQVRYSDGWRGYGFSSGMLPISNPMKSGYEYVVCYIYLLESDSECKTGSTLMLVNALEENKLDSSYVPSDLREITSTYWISGNETVNQMASEAASAFESMAEAATSAGNSLYGQSAYRSYERQSGLCGDIKEGNGQKYCSKSRDVAVPGHSEHQTGLAIDVSSTKSGNMNSFGSTGTYTWMQNNAHNYGFIERYREDIGTAYTTENPYGPEPWHWRYVGVEAATVIHEQNISLEKYISG